MKRFIQALGVLFSLFAIYIFLQGLKSVLHTEKAYIKYGDDICHSTPCCPRIGVDEMGIEYMQETGNVVGSEECTRREAMNDLALDLCNYCFSQYEIKERNDYFIDAFKDKYEEKVKEAKILREQKRMERADEIIKKGRVK